MWEEKLMVIIGMILVSIFIVIAFLDVFIDMWYGVNTTGPCGHVPICPDPESCWSKQRQDKWGAG